MEPERWRRIEGLFHRAVDLAAPQRANLLAEECGNDADLRARVERLLDDDAAGGDLFDQLEQRTTSALVDPMLGRSVGTYRLVARLAIGGMGVVYRAERSDGLFVQEVAVKLIRAERATEGMVRRFELERRALAALNHPGIARLHDGGTTDDGRPYLVMELVHGAPIDQYCEREVLPVAERLRLFVQVCRAVHFAHQNLVVHRDLKPGNILIDEGGAPKLLDFGISRLLEGDEDQAPQAATRTLARILTPEYASPEQLTGGAVTTAIDVYSLGVILYELMTGRKPFRCGSRSPADWERLVSEHVPARPSTVVIRPPAGADGADLELDRTRIAARFGCTPAGLGRRLRGDLDRIVLMALRKEPGRRYSSVQEFADDIERHLRGQPVLARGDSLWYRTSKLVRRNRVAFVSTCAVIAALLAGLVATRRSERRAQAQAEHAGLEADSFQGIADFLEDTFLPATLSRDRARLHLARDRILLHAERVRREYRTQDHIRANLLDALGQLCVRLDLFEEAEQLIREALSIREQAFGRGTLEFTRSLQSLGQLDYRRGDFERAAGSLREALEIQRRCEPGTHTDLASLANDLAACLRSAGQDEEAERLHLEALELRRGAPDQPLPLAETLNNLAVIHIDRGAFELAAKLFQEALDLRRSILGEQHLLTLQTSSNLANATWQLGRREEARNLLERVESGYRELGVDGEAGLASVLSSLGAMQLADGDLAAAERDFEEALELQSARVGPDHLLCSKILIELARLQQARGRNSEARDLWRQVLEIQRSSKASTRDLAGSLLAYGAFLWNLQACEEAVPVLEESITRLQALRPGDPQALGRAELVLGRCLASIGQRDEARIHLREAVRLLEANPRAAHDEILLARRSLEAVDAGAGE